MSRGPFDPGFEDLPERLPIFPLTGVLLLPRGRLPLNVFEPRYLAMTRHALGQGRMIGMVQPQEGRGDAGDPPVYHTGCAGRIVEFAETPDGRYLITLLGVARFDIGDELPRQEPFRIVRPDWQRFRADLAEDDLALDRSRLIEALKLYFKRHGIKADTDTLGATPIERLVNSLAMGCPFLPREKQALLEARGTAERTEVLTALVEMSVLDTGDAADGVRRH